MATMSTMTKASIFTKSFPQIPTSYLPLKTCTVSSESAFKSFNGVNIRSTQNRVQTSSGDIENVVSEITKNAKRGAEDFGDLAATSAESAKDYAVDAAGTIGDKVKEGTEFVKDGAANLLTETQSQAKVGGDMTGEAAVKVQGTVANAAENGLKGLSDAWDKATETLEKVKDAVVENGEEAK